MQNQAVAKAVQRIDHEIESLRNLRGDLLNAGFVRLTDAPDVTDTAGKALAATEKNAAIPDTLGNKIQKLSNDFIKLKDGLFESSGVPSDANSIKKSGIYLIHADVARTLNVPFAYGVLVNFNTGNSYVAQIAIDVVSGNFYSRIGQYVGSGYTSWKHIG